MIGIAHTIVYNFHGLDFVSLLFFLSKNFIKTIRKLNGNVKKYGLVLKNWFAPLRGAEIYQNDRKFSRISKNWACGKVAKVET